MQPIRLNPSSLKESVWFEDNLRTDDVIVPVPSVSLVLPFTGRKFVRALKYIL